jgi:hypothetical protein
MALPFIAKILSLGRVAANLKSLSSVIQEAAGITKQIKEIRSGPEKAPGLEGRTARLEKEVRLQASLNEKLNEQLEAVSSVLENVIRSLKYLNYAIYGIGAVALLALVITILK